MKGICLKIYVQEKQKHQGVVLYEWLLEQARRMKIPGGTAIRAVAGYGKDKKLIEQHFFELGSNVPIELTFVALKKEIDKFLLFLKKENISLFFFKMNVEFAYYIEKKR